MPRILAFPSMFPLMPRILAFPRILLLMPRTLIFPRMFLLNAQDALSLHALSLIVYNMYIYVYKYTCRKIILGVRSLEEGLGNAAVRVALTKRTNGRSSGNFYKSNTL